MIILSNCLSDTPDEGCLKVANSLIKRIKAADPGIMVISYERRSGLTDTFLKLNKLLLNGSLFRLLRQKREPVLYIPFPSRPIATAIRVFILSRVCNSGLQVLTTMNVPMGFPEKLLFRLSGVDFLVLSEEVQEIYNRMVGSHRVTRLKIGVDTEKFLPVTQPQVTALRKKYGFDSEKPLVLHVGHLNQGRNIEQLLKIRDSYQILLVTSSLTKAEQDTDLRAQLEKAGNIRIIDEYVPQIQEIYQMSDIYFFPVTEHGHCIDIPLSCLEAASCGKPVVTTRYGEMKAFEGKQGFYYLNNLTEEEIHKSLEEASLAKNENSRQSVLDYDWNEAISILIAAK